MLYPSIGAILGFLLPFIGVPMMVLGMHIDLPLATGIQSIDGFLYAMGDWRAIVLAGAIWGIPSAFAGMLLGCFILAIRIATR